MYPLGTRLSSVRLLAFLFVLLFIIDHNIANSTSPVSERFWERTGCHKVGHVRKIRIPSCIEFEIRTNACRGYCLSYSMPSTKEALSINPKQILTSVSQCCTIQETEDVVAKIMCEDGIRNFTFKSAKTCSCFHCKKE